MSVFVPNNIERLARSMMAQIQPLTGNRASGVVTMKAVAGQGDQILKPNTYLIPLEQAGALNHYLLKVARNPATVGPHNTGGDWTVTEAGTPITLISNVGGERYNLSAGTKIQFAQNTPGLENFDTADMVADADFTGGTNGPIKRVVIFEDLETADRARDFFDAKLGHYPAVMFVWQSSAPEEGRSTGASRGSTRAGRKTTANRETYNIFVISSKGQSDPIRRRVGQDIMEDITGLLTDNNRNRDGELLASKGNGVEINARGRVARGPNSYVYSITVRLTVIFQAIEARVFNPWLITQYQDLLPADGPLPEKALIDIKYATPQDP